MYEIIHFLNQKITSKMDLNILPSGSSRGIEELKGKKIDFALSSINESNGEKDNENNTSLKKAVLAKDPIIFLYKKAKSEAHNSSIPLTIYLREGGKERSSLMKAILNNKNNKKQKERVKSHEGSNNLIVKELPENNYLALEIFISNNLVNSIAFFPGSFIIQNKSLLKKYDIELFTVVTSRSNKKAKKEKSDLPRIRKLEWGCIRNLWNSGINKFTFIREFSIWFDASAISSNHHSDWLKQILLKSRELSKLKFIPQLYTENGTKQKTQKKNRWSAIDVQTIISPTT